CRRSEQTGNGHCTSAKTAGGRVTTPPRQPRGQRQICVWEKTKAEAAGKLRMAMANRDAGFFYDAGNITGPISKSARRRSG
ncbi:MAG: hypothetical protein AVDCRST_MAG37-3099, partial [uncultured Rubrobacteraceae bacterium]